MKTSPYINPLEAKDVQYWTRKWDITQNELYDAILETGSNNRRILKKYLKSKGLFLFPMGKTIHDFLLKMHLG